MKFFRVLKNTLRHHYGLTVFAYLAAAVLTGFACVWFMRAFEFTAVHRLDFKTIGLWYWLAAPCLFLLSVTLIRRFASCAAGTGIPQAIFAARNLSAENEKRLYPLVSPKTLVIKIIALLMAVWVGASTGREGPSVHVATCVFIGILMVIRRMTGFAFDMRSAVVAGGSAGLAAAFNTPLAGVTFAIEELASDYFSNFKDFVLLAIVVAAITAKSVIGDYHYFGRLLEPSFIPWTSTLCIGLAGGVLGALFSTGILFGTRKAQRIMQGKYGYVLPIVLSLGLLCLAYATHEEILGPGNTVSQSLVHGNFSPFVIWFPWTKMLATLLTYWSGIAGGIFAPSLSIGSAIGASVGYWLHVPTAACAIVGMAAFLSGTIQAPITSIVIIFEMANSHLLLLPIMLAALIGFIVARLLGAAHLYPALAEQYKNLLPQDTAIEGKK